MVGAPDAVAHGRPADGTVRLLRPGLDTGAVAVAAARQLELQYSDLSDVVAARGADALLAVLRRRGLPWAVVTSADRRLAAARLGVEPGDCLAVEGSPAGLDAGRAAGMATAALRGHDGDLRLADLAGLARFLDT